MPCSAAIKPPSGAPPSHYGVDRDCLLDNAAGHPLATATQLPGLFGVIVAPCMNHPGVPGQVAQFEIRRKQGQRGLPLVVHIECRQVTLMAGRIRPLVLSTGLRIQMAPGRLARHGLAILLSRVATWLFVKMESMQPGLQPFQVWRNQDTLWLVFKLHLTPRFANA